MKINTDPYKFLNDMWDCGNMIAIGIERDPTPNINIPYQLDFFNLTDSYPLLSLHFNSKNSFSVFGIDDTTVTKDMNNNPLTYKRLKGCGFTADLNSEIILITVNELESNSETMVHVLNKKVLDKAMKENDVIRQDKIYSNIYMVDEADVASDAHKEVRKDLKDMSKHSYLYRMLLPVAPQSILYTIKKQIDAIRVGYAKPRCLECNW